MAPFQVSDMPDLTGYVIIVTGGNSGIGYATTCELAVRGARVYIASRSEARASEAIDKMRKSTKTSLDLHFLEIDLQDLKSVGRAAQSFRKIETRLDILINNAGIMALPYKLTTDGFECHWQVNHLAHHALFMGVLPLLRSTAAASGTADRVRVVNVSSAAAFAWGPKDISWDDVNMTKLSGSTADWRRYGHSKLASIMHAQAIHLHYHNEGISSYSISPGVIKTNLQAANPNLFGAIIRFATSHLPGIMSPADGARTTLYCATSPAAAQDSGKYHEPFGEVKKKADKFIGDRKRVERLWELSNEELRRCGGGFEV
ncbi:MAG: hypothetical protein M1834_005914 [Cirrosporium novae-zelandiae]|nr:MAG: hypothetical protein M1834_005914 [Cirrosporium novae-zelandiae]